VAGFGAAARAAARRIGTPTERRRARRPGASDLARTVAGAFGRAPIA
jgi:hypothetical protein